MLNQVRAAGPLLCLALLSACGGDDEPENSSAASGRDYYVGAKSRALGAATNAADCATCHSTDGSLGRSGKSFKDIAYRTSFKGGGAATLLDGSNACITGWMGGVALTAADEKWMALERYLQELSDPAVTAPNALMPEVLADLAAYEASYAGGDATAGNAKYNASCAGCHSSGLVVGAAPAWTLAQLKTLTIGRIAQKVRTAGPPPSGSTESSDTTPGPMPFFEVEDLAVQDLKDIIAYIRG